MKFIVLLNLAGASAHGWSASMLQDAYQGISRICAALNPAQFNTISPENVLNWGLVHPRADG
jgi:hypothetical protein